VLQRRKVTLDTVDLLSPLRAHDRLPSLDPRSLGLEATLIHAASERLLALA
jgi:hypothetical protein